MKKLRVAVLYGGRSGEHEISLQSAASVIRNLDPQKYEVIPVSVDKEGRWRLNDLSLIDQQSKALKVFNDAPVVVLSSAASISGSALLPLEGAGDQQAIDVVFPVMHGPLCEDGTIQGLLELASIPYVGCGVLASAIGMDKEVAKRLIRDAGLPIVPYVSVRSERWEKNSSALAQKVANEIGYPLFVKPANLGSSVGIHKVSDALKLNEALRDAFRYDTKILIEKAIDAREIELAVLENYDSGATPLISIAGEVTPSHEFYSYEAKYLDENGAALAIPADLEVAQMKEAQRIALKVFEVLECEGMARVDLFFDRKTGEFYFNEINTIPGFTSISMYPKMWEASGISYQELLSRLIELALSRHARKNALIRDFRS